MITRIFVAAFLLVSLTSCEVPVEVELPHAERLVVDGFIGLEAQASELRVLRTLPPLARVDVSKMVVPGVTAVIEWKGASIPLTLNADSVTFALPAESTMWDDGIARLTVRGLGKTATASTRIPKRPVVLSTRLIDTTAAYGTPLKMVIADIEVDTATIVWFTEDLNRWGSDRRPMLHYVPKDVIRQSGSGPRTTVSLVVYSIESFAAPDSVNITLCSADPIYDRYLRSPFGSGEGLFGFSGVNPYFNLSGDGIGLFIGASSTKVGVKLR